MNKKLVLIAVNLVEWYSFFISSWWFWGGCASRGDLRYFCVCVWLYCINVVLLRERQCQAMV